jgi:hypothetical protein
MREQLLVELETPAGIQALQDAYQVIIRKQQLAKSSESLTVPEIPAVVTISFYLNQPPPKIQRMQFYFLICAFEEKEAMMSVAQFRMPSDRYGHNL